MTGKLAANGVITEGKKLAEMTGWEVNVHVMKYPVAALITTNNVLEELSKRSDLNYDYVILPGLTRGSARILERELNIKVVKGPKHYADISWLIPEIGLDRLSPDKPADQLIEEKLSGELSKIINFEVSMEIGELKVPKRPPPLLIVSEIEVSRKSFNANSLIEECGKRITLGADIVSISFSYESPEPEFVRKVIKVIRDNIEAPLAIDTPFISEMKRGISAGADLVLSLGPDTISKFPKELRDVAVVLIPVSIIRGVYPRTYRGKVRVLLRLFKKARSLGFKKLILDPVLDPPIFPGSMEGFMAARLISSKNEVDAPLMLGISNITEMCDVDSVGINALLTYLSLESGVSIIMTSERSHKVKNSTWEVSQAVKMSTLAYIRGAPPKDLGIDLLLLKDKKLKSIKYDISGLPVIEIPEEGTFSEYALDPLGFFKITINSNKIILIYNGKKGRRVLIGRSADSIIKKILELGLISDLAHAAYLGRELAKAEIALNIGKNYIQDEPLFKSIP